MISAKSILQHLKQELRNLYEPQEADSIASWLMEEFFGLRPVDIIAGKQPDLQGFERWQEALPLLRRHMPVQYVLGYSWFAGHRFAVGEGVLIPRQETEQLVRMAADFLSNTTKEQPIVVDLCTGTGCIAHSLSLLYPAAAVYAIDNSPQALYYAHLNARHLGAATLVKEADVLSPTLAENLPLCDVIVSNPPYVRPSEQVQMHARVLNFEPPCALFVPDSDPLVFYEAIAQTAMQCLKPGGWIGVEINEALGEATATVFRQMGFTQVAVRQDLHGKDRFVVARKC